jgi:hypothetical protein
VVVPIVPESGSVRSITISWSPAVSSNSGKYNGASTSRLTFSPVNIPTLKIAAASSPAVGDTKVAYISPLGSGGGSYNLSATESGGIAGASCSGSLCTVTLIGLPGGTWSNGVLSITSLNGDSSNITITANGGAGTTNLIKAQAKIDATAKSQDVIKRIVVYIPLSPTIWQPDFAVSAEYLCKNYRVDANGNASASTFYTPPMVSNTVCP